MRRPGTSRLPIRGLEARASNAPLFEFHILLAARKKYEFDETLYAFSGNVVFANFHAARVFAKKINDQRDLASHPERAIKAGQLNAMGLIDEINHFMLQRYEEVENPGVIGRAVAHLKASVGDRQTSKTLREFCRLLPPRDVYRGGLTIEEYLGGSTGGKQHAEVTVEEMIMLWFANINPAFAPFHELFNDRELREGSAYSPSIDALQRFFQEEKPFGPEGKSILEVLREPMLASPHSLEGQLAYIRKFWGVHLSPHFLDKLAGAGDLIREETKSTFHGGKPETVVPDYRRDHSLEDIDHERFTDDLEWMPNVIIIAKNTYVWLDQLSKKYQRSIRRLDEIPDEELDLLARWNFTGLWLIGIWERSSASQKMKQMMGNPEAVASAYSVYDYEIAHDLGGEDAFQNLRHRAWHRGIRLAGDMVPNHVGVYSKWVIERPQYFIQSAYAPFPTYHFTGHNFSDHPGVEIRIEDGYWDRRDAAVVFQRVDKGTGSVQYIYHGNDGTGMAWNDTAQLNFLLAEVREAVMQEIFRVARKFSIIRFDAAMVLAKRHFRRLWYPEPGSGGDIPSRADHAMRKDEFDNMFPVEFWREVVDRINRDMPSTLLLAEAFWMLEGYFVRSLGMHRVYNSAFMHMMMKQENAKYRQLIYKTLEFNPEILKRYVNFMSNPDEETAVEQFGTGDKYFGVVMMMATMPGLPMFAHGQVEGFTEKYGMEYQRAYYNEIPDQNLIARHEREVFPILGKRYLFSQVANFELFDFSSMEEGRNEHVFVYTNRAGDERALMCYNNRYESSSGTIGLSVLKVNVTGEESKRKTVGEALGLHRDDRYFYILKEHRSGMEFLRSGKEMCEQGMHIVLQGYEYQLFLGFSEVLDESGECRQLANSLGGRGIESVNMALDEMKLRPVHEALRALMSDTIVRSVARYWFEAEVNRAEEKQILADVEKHVLNLLARAQDHLHAHGDVKSAADGLRHQMKNARAVVTWIRTSALSWANPKHRSGSAFVLYCLLLIDHFERFVEKLESNAARGWDAFVMEKILGECISVIENDQSKVVHRKALIGILSRVGNVMTASGSSDVRSSFGPVVESRDAQQFLGVHEYRNTLYYRQEAFDELVEWVAVKELVRIFAGDDLTKARQNAMLKSALHEILQLKQFASSSGYDFIALRNLVKEQKKPVGVGV